MLQTTIILQYKKKTMPFKKGQSGNADGRKVGSVNKLPAFHREFIQSLLDTQKDRIASELEQLEGKDFFMAINNLMEFVLPKLSRQELTTNFAQMDEQQLDEIIERLKNTTNE